MQKVFWVCLKVFLLCYKTGWNFSLHKFSWLLFYLGGFKIYKVRSSFICKRNQLTNRLFWEEINWSLYGCPDNYKSDSRFVACCNKIDVIFCQCCLLNLFWSNVLYIFSKFILENFLNYLTCGRHSLLGRKHGQGNLLYFWEPPPISHHWARSLQSLGVHDFSVHYCNRNS